MAHANVNLNFNAFLEKTKLKDMMRTGSIVRGVSSLVHRRLMSLIHRSVC